MNGETYLAGGVCLVIDCEVGLVVPKSHITAFKLPCQSCQVDCTGLVLSVMA